jgi:hypothetical protein
VCTPWPVGQVQPELGQSKVGTPTRLVGALAGRRVDAGLLLPSRVVGGRGAAAWDRETAADCLQAANVHYPICT